MNYLLNSYNKAGQRKIESFFFSNCRRVPNVSILFIEANLPKSGPAQLELVLFKGQLYFQTVIYTVGPGLQTKILCPVHRARNYAIFAEFCFYLSFTSVWPFAYELEHIRTGGQFGLSWYNTKFLTNIEGKRGDDRAPSIESEQGDKGIQVSKKLFILPFFLKKSAANDECY